MRSLSRRFGIATLVVTLVVTLFGSTQAGIIPWAYNVIFGPVGCGPQPHAYPYAAPMAYGPMSYAAPRGYGCGPCRTPMVYRSSPCSPCSTGSCSTVVSYGPRASCETGREVTRWKSDRTQAPVANEVTKRAPNPVDAAPAPKTFANGDGAVAAGSEESVLESGVASPPAPPAAAVEVAGEESPGAVVAAPVVAPEPATTIIPAGGIEGDAGFGPTKPDADAPAIPGSFLPAVPGSVEEKPVGVPAPTLPEVSPTLPEALPTLPDATPANVDGEASWKLNVPTRRLAKHASYRNARIARRSVPVNSEYVIPSESVARIVSRD